MFDVRRDARTEILVHRNSCSIFLPFWHVVFADSDFGGAVFGGASDGAVVLVTFSLTMVSDG